MELTEKERIISYQDAHFIPRCAECGCYVKADKAIHANDMGLKDEPNGTCKKHGRIKMLFLGFY